MPFTEQEKNNLRNDGKFTDDQIEYFSNNDLDYTLIKEYQLASIENNQINGVSYTPEELNDAIGTVIASFVSARGPGMGANQLLRSATRTLRYSIATHRRVQNTGGKKRSLKKKSRRNRKSRRSKKSRRARK